MNKEGDPVSATMKINLSRISESDSNITKFMEKVDADVSRLPSNDVVGSTVSMVGKALQLTKNIMDNLSQVHHYSLCPNCTHGNQVHPILKVSWTVLSRVYEVNRSTECPAIDTNIKHYLTRLYRRQMSKMNSYKN